MDTIEFITSVEDGSISEDDFLDNVQEFVDTDIWQELQGSWQRMVLGWAENGFCSI